MTAHTVAAKRRAGRKKKAGPREPNGRLQREGVIDIMRPTLDARCRALGWAPSAANLAAARDQKAASTYGRWCLWGLVTEHQFEAADRHLVLLSRWRIAIGAPAPHARGMRMEDTPRGVDHSDAQSAAHRAVRAEFEAAERALADAGQEAAQAVYGLIEEDCPGHPRETFLRDVRAGLTALVKHYRIG